MKRYIPNQHGAWSMLAVPFLFGLLAAEPKPVHILMFLCWLLAYLFSYPMLQWLRTGKGERYKAPALLYGALLAPAGIGLLIWKPELLWYGAALLPLLAVNALYARLNRERSLVNDMAAIVQFSSIVFPVYWLGGGEDWRLAGMLFIISLLYFAGTVFYVKTLIREKGNPAYYAGSVIYHGLLLAAAALIWTPLLAVLAGILLIRAAAVPKIGLTVKQSGILEIGISALAAVLSLSAVL